MSTVYNLGQEIKRPPVTLIESFRKISVTIIGDSMERSASISSEIQPVSRAKLLGSAYTVRVPAGDNLLFYYAIDQAEPGDVIVVDGGGYRERALCGEIMASYAKKRGIVGFVVNGAIRDIDELSEMEFPVFARGTSPNGPYKNGPGEVNVPVGIGGRIIHPGDIIVGDSDGVVCIPQEQAKKVLERAQALYRKEQKMLKEIEENCHLDLEWMYQKLEQQS